MNSRTLTLAAFGAVLCGCLFSAKEERCAGGTIETTNGCKVAVVITARVMLPNGTPASGLPVYLLDEKDWLAKIRDGASIALDSVRTDTAGKFKFVVFDTTRSMGLLVNTETHGALIRSVRQVILDSLYGGDIGLQPLVTYEGVVETPPPGQLKVLLAGTPYSGDVDTAGIFRVPNVPPEKYSVIVSIAKPDLTVEVAVAKDVQIDATTPPDTLFPDTSKVLMLEDFEDLDNRSKVGPLFGGGWWDMLSDEYLGGNSRLIQPVNPAPANFSAAIRDGGGERTRSLQVRYQPGTRPGVGRTFSYVFAGLNIGSSVYNLSQVQRLTFFARGSGDLVVEFVQQPPGTDVHVVASARMALDSAWQEFTLAPADLGVEVFQFPENPASRHADFLAAKLPLYVQPPTTWQEMGGKAQAIRFLGTGGTEFWLDHVRIHGVDLGDLVK
jgi:hypothetical protein